MHKPRADKDNEFGRVRGRSALHQVLESVVKLEKSKVITGPADSVGLMLWNVDVSCADLLEVCHFERALELMEIVEENQEYGQLQTGDICLSELTNDQRRGDQEDNQACGAG